MSVSRDGDRVEYCQPWHQVENKRGPVVNKSDPWSYYHVGEHAKSMSSTHRGHCLLGVLFQLSAVDLSKSACRPLIYWEEKN